MFAMDFNYEPLEIEQLIAEVKSRPVIWNTNTEDYNDKTKKAQAWQEVCEVCTNNWEGMTPVGRKAIGKEIQKRWKNVRDHYVRELKMMACGAVRKKRKYIYFDRLSFLGTMHQNRISFSTHRNKPPSNLSENSGGAVNGARQEDEGNEDSLTCAFPLASYHQEKKEVEEESEANPRDCEAVSITLVGGGGQDKGERSNNDEGEPPPGAAEAPDGKGKKCGRRAVKKVAQNFKASLLDILQRSLNSRDEQSGDEDRLFLLSLVSELKRVPAARRLLVKTQIIQAILQGQQFRDPNSPR